MLTIVLTFIVINVILPVILKPFGLRPRLDVLGCGLVGYSGNVPANPQLLKLLLMYNMDRGEDSTGWVVNNKIVKSIKKVSEFLAENELILKPVDENYSFIGHARNGSSGSKLNPNLAHPFGMYKNGIEKDKYDLVLAMNGTFETNTIHEFAKKFDLDYSYNQNSDTELMAKAMANLGEKNFKKVLECYPGAATLLFFSPKYPNTLMAWKDPARPLFIWNRNKNQAYISSLKESLIAIGAPEDKVLEFIDSHLYVINKGVITSCEEIKRDPIKPYVYRGKMYNDDDYEGYYQNWGTGKSKTIHALANSRLTVADMCDKPISLHSNKGNKIYCIMDKFYRNGHPCDGPRYVNPEGKMTYNKEDKDYDSTYEEMFFISGYRIKNKELYDELLRKCTRDPDEFNKDPFDIEKFKAIFVSELCNTYCGYPLITNVRGLRMWVVPKEMNDTIKNKKETSEYTPVLSEYKFTMGYTNKLSRKTGSKFFSDVDINKISVSSDVSEVSNFYKESENIQFICGLLKNSEGVTDSLDIFSEITSKQWRKNKSADLSRYFHEKVLLPLLVDDGHLPKDVADDLIKQAENKNTTWAHKSIQDELKASIRSLKRKVKNEGSVESFHEKEELFQKTTKEKIKQLSLPGTELNISDVIKSIKESNHVYNNGDLCRSVWYAGEFDSIIGTYLTDPEAGGKETMYFYEAILLLMLDAQVIKEEELLQTIDSDLRTVISKAQASYGLWMALVNEKSTDTNKEDKNEERKKEVEEEFDNYIDDIKKFMEETIAQANLLEKEEKPENFNNKISSLEKAKQLLETNND